MNPSNEANAACPEETPGLLESLKCLCFQVAYFAVIFGLRAMVSMLGPAESVQAKAARPQKKSLAERLLQVALCLHNAILCILSAAMFLGAGYEAYRRIRYSLFCRPGQRIRAPAHAVLHCRTDGVRWMFCEETSKEAKGAIYFWTYVYYLSKFQEFIDTFFKVSRPGGAPLVTEKTGR